MFPATPPRRIWRSPTRNDTEILWSLSAISVSVNLPAKVIRWSVAIDPVTAIRIFEGCSLVSSGGTYRENLPEKRHGPARSGRPARISGGSVERVAAGARTRRVRVVDREALLLDRVDEVDGRAHEVRRAHLVGDDPDAAELADNVAVERALVKVQLVAQARAAARLNGDAQLQVVAALLADQRADLLRGRVGEDDALLRHFVRDGHW